MRGTISILALAIALFFVPASEAQERLLITDFGARGDGIALNTRSIQACIDSAAAAYSRSGRQCRAVVPPGRFVSGTLYLKSGVCLELSEGAVLLGSTNPFDYVKDPTCRLMAFIFAVGQHDIALTGRGTIDGRGFLVANAAVNAVHLGLLQDPLKYDRCNEANRPQNVHFRDCENVVVRHITLKDPANWCQEYDRCRNLLIDGITVDAKCYWNNDGLDVVDCRDVVIRNCRIDASDDAYCFKSHSTDGISENVTVENCYGRSSANGIKFGTVTRGAMRHFRFKDIVIENTYRSAITIASVDGSIIEDIEIDGLRALHTGNALFLRFASRNRAAAEPCVRDIAIRNLYAEIPADKPDAGYSYEGPVEDLPRNISPASIVGIPGHRIQNVLLENVEIVYAGGADSGYAYRGTSPAELSAIPEWERRYPEFSMWKELPAWGLYLRHADNITLRNVTLRSKGSDYRPAIVADDVSGLSIEKAAIDHPAADRKQVQLVANNCSKTKNRSKLKSVQQKSRNAAASGIEASQTASDIILAQDNSTPCTQGAKLYRASMFGCKSNGTTMNTNSIQKAIDYIAQQGGGTLVFEVGRYLTGSIHLKAGVDIELNEGAILVGSDNAYDFDNAYGAPALLIGATPQEDYVSGAISAHVCGLGRIELPAGTTDATPDVELLIN